MKHFYLNEVICCLQTIFFVYLDYISNFVCKASSIPSAPMSQAKVALVHSCVSVCNILCLLKEKKCPTAPFLQYEAILCRTPLCVPHFWLKIVSSSHFYVCYFLWLFCLELIVKSSWKIHGKFMECVSCQKSTTFHKAYPPWVKKSIRAPAFVEQVNWAISALNIVDKNYLSQEDSKQTESNLNHCTHSLTALLHRS